MIINNLITGKVILVVDDVKINYILIRGLLRDSGAEVFWAENGYQAIDFFNSKMQLDLILMDFHMPGLDGYETALKIKQQKHTLPIICQTTGTSELRKEDKRKVFDDVIIKPINREILLKKISQYIA